MSRIELPYSPSARSAAARSRWAFVLATSAALMLGGTPEVLESAGCGALLCDDDDDDARRARAAREALTNRPLVASTTAPGRTREVGPVDPERPRTAVSAQERIAHASQLEHASCGDASFARPPLSTELPRRALVLARASALRAALARAPVVSPEVEPAVGPGPPAATFPTHTIPLARECRAMDRAHEAAARTARTREDRLRSRESRRAARRSGSRAS